jgi:hypothetical protein
MFYYTSWRFYAFYRTNLLIRCHSASSLFLLFLCFKKAIQEIFSELDKTKSRIPIFPDMRQTPKMRRRGTRGRPHHTMARPPGHAMAWCGPLAHSLTLPFRLYIPSTENLRGPINFPWNLLRATAVVDARSGGSRSFSRHPAGEGNHRRRPSSSPWSPPEWCVSSLPWTTCP